MTTCLPVRVGWDPIKQSGKNEYAATKVLLLRVENLLTVCYNIYKESYIMRPTYSDPFSVIRAVMAVLLLGFARVACGHINEDFEKQLLRIRNKSVSTDTLEERALWEENCLELIKDHNSPAEKGIIYATVTLLYARSGLTLPNQKETRFAKTFQYGKKAIEHPIPDVLISCEVHGRLAGAMFVKAREGPQERFAESRREAIVICLKGLKLALDNKAPKERPDPPPPMFVPHMITPNKGAKYQEAMAKYKKQLAQWKKFRHLSRLHNQRSTLTHRSVIMYSVKQYDTEELREYATQILGGYEDVVNDLVGQVQKRISEK